MQSLVRGALEILGEIGGILRDSGVQRVMVKERVFEAGNNGRAFSGEGHGGWAFGFEGMVDITVF